MGIKFGEIDAGQIIENEYKIGVLENALDLLMQKNANLTRITKDEFEQIRRSVVKKLQTKYPKTGLELKL